MWLGCREIVGISNHCLFQDKNQSTKLRHKVTHPTPVQGPWRLHTGCCSDQTFKRIYFITEQENTSRRETYGISNCRQFAEVLRSRSSLLFNAKFHRIVYFYALFSKEETMNLSRTKVNTVGAFLSPEAERKAMQCHCFSTKFNLPQHRFC